MLIDNDDFVVVAAEFFIAYFSRIRMAMAQEATSIYILKSKLKLILDRFERWNIETENQNCTHHFREIPESNQSLLVLIQIKRQTQKEGPRESEKCATTTQTD